MAGKIGISEKTVKTLELGKNYPSLAVLAKYAIYFETTMHDLIYQNKETNALDRLDNKTRQEITTRLHAFDFGNYGHNLSILRGDYDMTQGEFSLFLCIETSALKRCESGKGKFGLENTLIVTEFAGITVDELLFSNFALKR